MARNAAAAKRAISPSPLQISHQPLKSSLDVLLIMAIAWTLDKVHTSPVRTREKTEEGAERGGHED